MTSARNVDVGRMVQGALVDVGRNGPGSGRDLRRVDLGAADVEGGTDLRQRRADGLWTTRRTPAGALAGQPTSGTGCSRDCTVCVRYASAGSQRGRRWKGTPRSHSRKSASCGAQSDVPPALKVLPAGRGRRGRWAPGPPVPFVAADPQFLQARSGCSDFCGKTAHQRVAVDLQPPQRAPGCRAMPEWSPLRPLSFEVEGAEARKIAERSEGCRRSDRCCQGRVARGSTRLPSPVGIPPVKVVVPQNELLQRGKLGQLGRDGSLVFVDSRG